MVMMAALLDDARAVNARLGHSIDELIAELAAARAWARTVYPPTPSDASVDEQSHRNGAASRGPV